jgi:hypothetical protein
MTTKLQTQTTLNDYSLAAQIEVEQIKVESAMRRVDALIEETDQRERESFLEHFCFACGDHWICESDCDGERGQICQECVA